MQLPRPTRLILPLAAALLGGCSTSSGVTGPCDELCRELVQECGFTAYPSRESCYQGCDYNQEQGADIDAQLTCVQAAACDTFAIVECEHAHGTDR